MTVRTSLQRTSCPVGRTVDAVGDLWSLLIVRDAIHGITRFEDFRDHLGISPTTLTARLRHLVDKAILTRRRYEDRPPRDEYVLTDRGRELVPVVLALGTWWNDALDPSRRAVVVVDAETGAEVEPVVVDRRTGEPIEWPRHRFAVGPAATRSVRQLVGSHDIERAST